MCCFLGRLVVRVERTKIRVALCGRNVTVLVWRWCNLQAYISLFHCFRKCFNLWMIVNFRQLTDYRWKQLHLILYYWEIKHLKNEDWFMVYEFGDIMHYTEIIITHWCSLSSWNTIRLVLTYKTVVLDIQVWIRVCFQYWCLI